MDIGKLFMASLAKTDTHTLSHNTQHIKEWSFACLFVCSIYFACKFMIMDISTTHDHMSRSKVVNLILCHTFSLGATTSFTTTGSFDSQKDAKSEITLGYIQTQRKKTYTWDFIHLHSFCHGPCIFEERECQTGLGYATCATPAKYGLHEVKFVYADLYTDLLFLTKMDSKPA
jgi:hypothetical protein